MKIAITDANIFIELLETELHTQFFSLRIEVHTSFDVLEELYDHQKQILLAYASSGKLTVHILTEIEQTEIRNFNFPKSFTPEDKSVIFLARKLEAMILTSDKPVRNYAKSECIECHGFIWILDELISQNIISNQTAYSILKSLFEQNLFYQNNIDLKNEIEKRLSEWSK